MTWTIITGGQTGVDTGALLGARDEGLRFSGWAPKGWKTEAGEVPVEYRVSGPFPASGLHEHHGGYYPRTLENVGSADLLLLVVPSVLRPCDTPGTKQTVEAAMDRRRHLPMLSTDGSQLEAVRHWLRSAAVLLRQVGRGYMGSEISLMVAGPRASRWPEGEAVARAVVSSLFRTVTRAASRQLDLPL